MKYIFGHVKLQGKFVHVLKTVGSEHTNLTGTNQIERKFSDSIVTDEFVVVEKYLSKTDSANRCYDWYIITDHYRYIDYFTPRAEELEEDSEGVLDLADMVDENSTAICDLADYVAELEERISALEV